MTLPKNKFSDVSDIDLLKMVLDRQGYIVSNCNYIDKYFTCLDGSIIYATDKLFYFELMIDNRMHVMPHRYKRVDSWHTQGVAKFIENDKEKISYPEAWNESLCRAIAECYLLIKDAENA